MESMGRRPARKRRGGRPCWGRAGWGRVGHHRSTKIAFRQLREPSRPRLQRGPLEELTSRRTGGETSRRSRREGAARGGGSLTHTLASAPRSSCSLDRAFAPFPPPLYLPPYVLLFEMSFQPPLSAALRGNAALVKRLLKKDKGAGVTGSEGGASLHRAVCGNHRRLARART